MGRKSFNSKKNFLAANALKPRKGSRAGSLQEQIMETKLRSEQVKLQKLEAELPDEDVKYMKYEDMPPPSPEQEAAFEAEFQTLLNEICSEPIGPDDGQSVQDWLTAQGATIPDRPEWQTPLYLEKFHRVRGSGRVRGKGATGGLIT